MDATDQGSQSITVEQLQCDQNWHTGPKIWLTYQFEGWQIAKCQTTFFIKYYYEVKI